MTSRYKILFAIDILNDYYRDNRCMDFSVLPSASTALLLKKYRLLCKLTGNKLVVLVQVDAAGIPIVVIDTDAKFVFYLELNKPSFTSFTNINMNMLAGRRFWFTNIPGNKAGDILNLTAAIASYDNDTLYNPGDFATDGSSNVFECVKAGSGNNTGTDSWVARGNTQFVSAADMIPASTRIFNYAALVPQTNFTISVFGLNTATNQFTQPVKTVTQSFDEPVKNIQLDLTVLQAGKYRMVINADELLVYIDDAMVHNNYFGVIELFSHLPNTDDFGYFKPIPAYNNATPYKRGDLADDGDGNIFECINDTTGNDTGNTAFWLERNNIPGLLKEVNYTIHFANRRAFWKYYSAYRKVDNIKVKGSHDPVITPFMSFSSDPDNPDRKDFFISEQQLLLTEKIDENNFELMLVSPLESFTPPAPKPDITVSGMLTKQAEDFFCNIYLSY